MKKSRNSRIQKNDIFDRFGILAEIERIGEQGTLNEEDTGH